MFNTLWKKRWRDMWQSKGRSLTVLLSVAVSVFLLGLILFSYSILSREMNRSFARAQPHAVSFRMEAFENDLLEEIKGRPGVKEVEARRVISSRIQRENGDWVPMLLYVLRDYNDIALDIVEPERGSWPPENGELLIERQALSVLRGTLGRTYALESDEGIAGRLKLAGLTYDVVLPQAEMENIVYGYVSFETLREIGGTTVLNELSLSFHDQPSDIDYVRWQAAELRAWLTQRGYTVVGTDIPIPGRHPHYQITRSMFIIQEMFGILLSLFISILIYNLTAAILSSQVRQIGVMKAVGAQIGQIGKMYYGSLFYLGLAGLALAMPFALAGSGVYAENLAVMMNFDIEDGGASLWTYLVVVGLGLGIPLLTASLPIRRASRIPVRETLVDYGVSRTHVGKSLLDRLVGKMTFLGRPTRVGVRNAFRKKGRLFLTTCVLAIGAAFNMGALNLETTVASFVNDLQGEKVWGVRVSLNEPYSVDEVTSRLIQVSGVRQVEPFFQTGAAILNEKGKTVLTLPLTAVYPKSEMLRHPFLDGRWLGGSGSDIVINQYLANRMPQLEVGSELTLRLNERVQVFRICGIVKTLGAQQAFVSYPSYAASAGLIDFANGFYLVGENGERAYLRQLRNRARTAIKESDYELRSIVTSWQGLEVLEDHFIIIFNMILSLTVVIILVGGNGIILSMRANIMEQKREIGIMKAIGASKDSLFRIILGEGAIIGLLSWLLAVVLMIPISYLISYGLGMVLIHSPLPLVVSPFGILISLPFLLFISAVACLIPARSIAKLSVRDTLLYE